MDDLTLRSIRILAVKSVENPDWESSYRKICRWYSKEFSTPLKQVESLSEYDVLLTYFEETYQNMASSPVEEMKNRYKEIKTLLIKGEEIVKQEQVEIEQQDDAWAAEMAEEIKKQQEKDEQNQQSKIETEPNLIDVEDKFELQGESHYSNDL